jgi:hypothetical protein
LVYVVPAPETQQTSYRDRRGLDTMGSLFQPHLGGFSMLPIRPGRSAAENRYRALRHLAFQKAEATLGSAGIKADLSAVDATALDAFAEWRNRRVGWPWADMVPDWRRGYPERFEMAVWSDDTLCGLALGRPSPGPSHLALYYMEGAPPRHRLKGRVMTVVLTALRAYAITLGKKELRLVEPFPELIPTYCSPAVGFQLVTPLREAPYCRRSI